MDDMSDYEAAFRVIAGVDAPYTHWTRFMKTDVPERDREEEGFYDWTYRLNDIVKEEVCRLLPHMLMLSPYYRKAV